jgi:ABC-type transport system involved in multi-copper enzyme maturation permease subunit
MNAAIVSALLRQRLASPMRLFIVSALFVPALALAVFTNTFGAVAGGGYWFALVLAAGAIGQDVSSGVLHLTFARPVTRTAYVTSRWFAAAAGGFALALARLLLASALLAMRGAAPEPLVLLAAVIQDALLSSVAAAVMVAFSALVDGLGDVAVFALSTLGLQIAHGLAQMRGWTLADRAIVELQHTLEPALNLAFLSGQGAPQWGGLVTAASTVVLALALAILAVNRRELSYAAG